MIEIRTAANDDVLDHGVPHVAQQQAEPNLLANAFIDSPIENTERKNDQEFFAKHGERRYG